jgi:hypothetical protein
MYVWDEIKSIVFFFDVVYGWVDGYGRSIMWIFFLERGGRGAAWRGELIPTVPTLPTFDTLLTYLDTLI